MRTTASFFYFLSLTLLNLRCIGHRQLQYRAQKDDLDDQPHVAQHGESTPVGIQLNVRDYRYWRNCSQSIGYGGYW